MCLRIISCKREVTVDSYSETISSDSSSDDSTLTADPKDSTSSMEDNIEDKSCLWETDSTEIEASLHQIASGLQNAAEVYMTLASHISKIKPILTATSNSTDTPTSY